MALQQTELFGGYTLFGLAGITEQEVAAGMCMGPLKNVVATVDRFYIAVVFFCC